MIPIDIFKTYRNLIYIVLAVAACVALYVFGPDIISGNGRVDQVKDNLSTVRSEQSSAIGNIGAAKDGINIGSAEAGRIADGIGKVAEGIGGVETSLDRSNGKVDTSTKLSTDSAGLIAEGQRILEQVGKRGQAGN